MFLILANAFNVRVLVVELLVVMLAVIVIFPLPSVFGIGLELLEPIFIVLLLVVVLIITLLLVNALEIDEANNI